MPMTIIRGEYRITGASPDGDSVRFYPEDPHAFARAHIRAKTNANGGVQLRLDAIDALETHYAPPGSTHSWHQPPALGAGAAQAVLEFLGFTEVSRDARGTVTASTPDVVPGYIVTRSADKYGRVVALAFAGEVPEHHADSTPFFLDVTALRRSVNHQMLVAGWAYPTFYSNLYVDLRDEMSSVVEAARAAKVGVWAGDVTTTGFTLEDRQQLTDSLVILPKLFRRLAEYVSLDETGGVDLRRFTEFLSTHGDKLFTIPAGQWTSLDTLVERHGQTIRLTTPPEHIVFLEE